MSEHAWKLLVAVADIPETGRRLEITADASTRAAVAKVANVPALPRFAAEFELTRHGGDGVRVVGSVSATVEQNCVLTLELMQSEISETIDLIFSPPRVASSEADEAERAPPGEPPEILHDGAVDLAAIAIEFLILGIDPYPRKPGAVFNAPPTEEDKATHPFAALAALKKGSQDT